MVRALLTTNAGLGHFHPLVPLAGALSAAGHDVVLACPPSVVPVVEAAGFLAVPVGIERTIQEIAGEADVDLSALTREQRREFVRRHNFAGPHLTHRIHDLFAFAESFRPDLFVRECFEFAGCIAGERLGLPHAALQIVATLPDFDSVLTEPLNRLRSGADLPPDPHRTMLSRYLTLSPFPPSYQPPHLRVPTMRFFRSETFDRTGDEALPDWIHTFQAAPTVYATLGTAFNSRTDVFRTILDAFAAEPINLILTVGRSQDPAQFGPQPSNVHVERYIPQSLVFPQCDLVVSHGGSGTTLAALAHGLPLVVIPFGADQPDNAERLSNLGAARTVEPSDLSRDLLRTAVQDVLRDPTYRRNAQLLRDELHALPGLDHAVTLLEHLAGTRAPIPAGHIPFRA